MKYLKKLCAGGTPILLFLILYTVLTLFVCIAGAHRMPQFQADDISLISGWTDDTGKAVDVDQLEEVIARSSSGTISLQRTLPQLTTDSYLSFYTYGTFFTVSIDGTQVYSYDYTPIFTAGHSYGTDFHSILIPAEDSGKTIAIEAQIIYGNGASFFDMTIGKSSTFIVRYLQKMLPSFILSLVAIIFGVIIFVMAKSISEDAMILRSLRAFAVLSVAVGLWALIET